MVAFYGAFLAPGDLAFDVGSHVGNRVRAFRRAGARVVAVEPQPDLLAVLRTLYGRDPRVRIEPCALAAEPGEGVLHLATRAPTVSSLAPGWIRDVRADPRFAQLRWDREVVVPLRTLDELIARHGEPRFCKIDVEGHELEVLRGLTRALPALSFEYIPVVADRAVACVERLAELGEYRFASSPVETWRWATPWVTPEDMVLRLSALSPDARPGDVYAVRSDVTLHG